MQYYYLPNLNKKINYLTEEEARHCIKVLRHKVGDIINITNGKGNLYEAEITIEDVKKCEIKIINEINTNQNKKDFYLHIAIAPTKNIDRFETFLEKATEIGVAEITPLICAKSERKKIKPERLNKILISAMKQSLKTKLPKLNKITYFSDFINKSFTGEKYIAYCLTSKNNYLKKLYKKSENALVLIGPEGDFTDNEIELALNNKFEPTSLGESRLRTETAGIVACQIINFMNE